MPRTKPENSITTRGEAEHAMARLNQIDTQLAKWDLTEAEAIAAVREWAAAEQKNEGRPAIEAEKKLLVKELEGWAEDDRESWGKKSIETPFGRLGFREKNPAVVLYKGVAKKLEEALDRLALRLPEFVRQTPSIDKEKILAAHREQSLDLAKLQRCGLRIEEGEDFWVETEASRDLERAVKELRNA